RDCRADSPASSESSPRASSWVACSSCCGDGTAQARPTLPRSDQPGTAEPMGAPHGHALHYHGHSVVHRRPSHVKIVTLVVYVLAVVATPRGAFWPYAAHLLALVAAVIVSRVPLGHLAK